MLLKPDGLDPAQGFWLSLSLVPVDNGFSYVPVVNVGSTGVIVNTVH